jgi:hypothetical protein
MKLIAVAAAAVALAAAACGRHDEPAPSAPAPAAAPKDDAAPPHLQLRESRVSFGTRYDDEEPEIVFVLANTGGRPLVVEHIDTNCGCARVGEKPASIEPGKSADVHIKIKLDGMSGPITRAASFHTDDPSQPVVRGAIVGEVRPRLVAEPARIRFEPATAQDATAVDIDVKGSDGGPLDGLTAFSGTMGLTVSTTISGATARVHVAAAPFAEDYLGSVVLRLGKYERILPVMSVAPRDVRASPEKLVAGVVRSAVTLETRLVGRPGVDWRVVAVQTSRRDLTAEYADGMLRVRIAEDAPAGALVGRVTVLLEGAKPDRVTVNVVAFVEK